MTLQQDFDKQTETNNSFQQNNQYFTFILDNEEYGVNILHVLEIRGFEKVTAIPSAPEYIKGVINLRGNIIPVMDLRERFKIEPIPYNRSTVLIVIQVGEDKLKKRMGVIVDAVSDVYSIDPSQIQPRPEACNTSGQEYISGLVPIKQKNTEDKLVILLDVSKLLNLNMLPGTINETSDT
ncbi:chemotaxis protein CheW [Candidatus Berkiella aquae]|uniref:Chemotaxis protein CheW n=1 Tax=Candidatus Berkiella aquae TaxID=295108 RepID=A0A0Q9Z0R4_9GAMM|nr:chemotaxis protein CheW [Candidatus Berkiella aquae]MCS5712010.1 chemotaxis protein CheW [Candidatus Berkiella aquae]